ncbi:MAG: hypothetical protein JWM88_3449, partial [Verrucomicrobia bacterium]|nr:hypothetical protein [Verrucomicrobiota bacterium]
MRTLRRKLLATALSLTAWSALRAATPVIGAQLFQDTNARIEDLFGHRNNPPKPPGPQDNPFRPVDALVSTAENPSGNPRPGAEDPVVVETTDEGLLRLAYGRLSFGGLIQVGDRPMVVI